jgi:tetratricopeptide (TPR) repeat protein
MLARADHHELAVEDYLRALDKDPDDHAALGGLVKSALILKKAGELAVRLQPAAPGKSESPQRLVARSKLLAAEDRRDEAIAVARSAAAESPLGLEQLASLFADSADTVRLDAAVDALRKAAPNLAATEYYAAVAAFLHGNTEEAAHLAERAIGIDRNYTPSYDLVGAAYTKMGRVSAAKKAFEQSLSFDAHDSTAYENLGGRDDIDQTRALVKLLVVAVDDHGIRIERREPAEFAVDQPEAPHHVLDFLVIAIAHSDVLFDRVGARRQHHDPVGTPRIAD